MYQMISGAIMMASWVVALFFLRFWRTTHDRLFGIFAIAFAVMGTERLVLGFYFTPTEELPLIYLLRLSSFLLIILGILDKNRNQSRVS